MTEEKHLYRTSLRWETERRGRLTAAGLPELAVATPPEFPEDTPAPGRRSTCSSLPPKHA